MGQDELDSLGCSYRMSAVDNSDDDCPGTIAVRMQLG